MSRVFPDCRNHPPFHVEKTRLEDDKAVGARIRLAREEANLDQAQLAQKVGVNFKTVSKWENGLQTTRKRYLEKISHATGKPMAWLMVGERSTENTAVEPPQLTSAKVRGLVNRVLAEIAESGGSENDEAWAKSVLSNPLNFPADTEDNESRLLRDVEALAVGVRAVLARRGLPIPLPDITEWDSSLVDSTVDLDTGTDPLAGLDDKDKGDRSA